MPRLVRVRPWTFGTSHSAPRLTLYFGVAGARLPSKVPLVVSFNSLSMYITPPSSRNPSSGSPNTLTSTPSFCRLPLGPKTRVVALVS
ncbi:hypothetical protein D3C73_1163680 [compost metagenome]